MPLRDRRRLLLSDERRAAAAAVPPRVTVRRGEADDDEPVPAKRYSPAARRDRQPRLVDLVPSRRLTLAGWLAFGLTVIGALEVAYLWMPPLVEAAGEAAASIVDLAPHRGLASWFSALLLGTTGLCALLVYSLRRHRVDDYHGRYRVWVLAAAAFLALSVEQTTALSRLGQALVAAINHGQRLGENPVVWTVACAVVVGLFGLRILVEIRLSWAASLAWLVGCASLVGALLVERGWATAGDLALQTMAAAGCRMLGHLLLLTSIGLYARHVMLDAEGLLPVRRRKRRVEKKSPLGEEQPGDGRTRIDPSQSLKPHAAPRTDLPSVKSSAAVDKPAAVRPATASARPEGPLASRIHRPAAASDDDDHEGDDDDSSAARQLSRAERKRLKRELRRQQRGPNQ